MWAWAWVSWAWARAWFCLAAIQLVGERENDSEVEDHDAYEAEEDVKQYNVDKLLYMVNLGRGYNISVRWEGFGEDGDTWEPITRFVPLKIAE